MDLARAAESSQSLPHEYTIYPYSLAGLYPHFCALTRKAKSQKSRDLAPSPCIYSGTPSFLSSHQKKGTFQKLGFYQVK